MDRPPAIDRNLVEEMVRKAHGDLDRVKQLVGEKPALVNATWDWGGGDFESALGAAAHVGRRDIATFLLENGARLDLFAAAMLGKLDVVKAVLGAFPAGLGCIRQLCRGRRRGAGSCANHTGSGRHSVPRLIAAPGVAQ